MSPVASLFIALLVLHVLDGVFWVRRGALALSRGLRGYRRVPTSSPLGNKTHCFLFAWPLPPLPELLVVEPWPLTLGAESWAPLPAELGLGAEAVGEAEPRPAPDRGKLQRDAKELVLNGQTVTTSSYALSTRLARLYLAWAEAKAKKRPALVAAERRARFDRAALEARLGELRRETRWLHVLCNLFPLILYGALAAFFLEPRVAVQWPVLLAMVGTLLVSIWIETYRVHRRLYPDERGDRRLKLLLLVLSFPAAARARAWLLRDGLAGFHPLAVGLALLPEQERRVFAGQMWRALRHPLAEPEDCNALLAAERAALAELYREALAQAGLEVPALEAPPAQQSPRAQAYCPRCRAEYGEPTGPCPDCPGVQRVGFTPPPAPVAPAAQAG